MNNKLTEIVFILDRSGSMSGLEDDTIGGFNSFLAQQTALEDTILTTVLFDDRYEILHNGVNAKDIKLTKKEYFTRGYTALLDALGKTINEVGKRLAATEEDNRPGDVIFVIITDGYENASRKYTYEGIRKMITHQKEKYSWQFIFLAANIENVQEEGSKLGIDVDLSIAYEASKTGTEKLFVEIPCWITSAKNKQYRRNKSSLKK